MLKRSTTMVRLMDNGQVFIFLLLVTNSIAYDQPDMLKIGGNVTIVNPKPFYQRGDDVTFAFDVTFNLTSDVETLNISIGSSTVEVTNSTMVAWTLDGLDTDPDLGSQPRINASSTELDEEFVDSGMNFQVHLVNISSNRWRFHGTCSVSVKDDVGPGCRVQAMVTVMIPAENENTSLSGTVPSEYRYTPPLAAKRVPPPSNVIGIMKLSAVNITLTLTEDNVSPLVEVITPYENTSREVMLTINNVEVPVNDTFGLNQTSLNNIAAVEPEMKSTLMTYQRDIGSVQLPVLVNNDTVQGSGVTVKVTLRLEDYTMMKNGDALTVGAGVKFGDGMIWVSSMTYTVDAPDAENRKPDLQLKFTASAICAGEDINDVNLSLDLIHTSTSTATAYDVLMNIFPMPEMTLQRWTSVSPIDFPFVINNTGTYLRILLGRLTFSDPAQMTLTMRVQMNSSHIRDSSYVTIPAEVVYNDRWNDSLDTISPLQYVNVDLNKKCAERYTWSSGSTCTCQFDPSRSDCGCCIDYAGASVVQCGAENPDECAPVTKPWLCWKRIHRHLSESRLTSSGPDLYECDASQKYSRQRNGQPSCYKGTSSRFKEVHPMVSVITGKDSASDDVYGISSNGYAYIISESDGKSWCTIRESYFQKIESRPTFSTSSFK